jgi:hypothetical protein
MGAGNEPCMSKKHPSIMEGKGTNDARIFM